MKRVSDRDFYSQREGKDSDTKDVSLTDSFSLAGVERRRRWFLCCSPVVVLSSSSLNPVDRSTLLNRRTLLSSRSPTLPDSLGRVGWGRRDPGVPPTKDSPGHPDQSVGPDGAINRCTPEPRGHPGPIVVSEPSTTLRPSRVVRVQFDGLTYRPPVPTRKDHRT